MTNAELKEARRKLGHTQQRMAEAMGVPLRTYQGWEAGRTIPGWVPRMVELISNERIRGKENGCII